MEKTGNCCQSNQENSHVDLEPHKLEEVTNCNHLASYMEEKSKRTEKWEKHSIYILKKPVIEKIPKVVKIEPTTFTQIRHIDNNE